MQLPGQNLPLQQKRDREKSLGCQKLCVLSLTTASQSKPFHSASSPRLKSVYPHSCFLHRLYILHFQNHWFNRILSLPTNESNRADRLRKHKITTSTDLNWTETLFIWNTEHQVGSYLLQSCLMGSEFQPSDRIHNNVR